MYKYLEPGHPSPERWQGATSLIISHLQLPVIICPAIVSARSCMPKGLRNSTRYQHQYLLIFQQCSPFPNSSWHLLSSAMPCLPWLSQTLSRKFFPRQAVHLHHHPDLMSKDGHHFRCMYQDFPARELSQPIPLLLLLEAHAAAHRS